jgi:serine protease inhibitor
LNPIELLWHPMLVSIRKKFCKTAEDVVDAINEWMDTVTPEMCRKIIDTLKTNIPIVIKNKGGWSNR